MYEIPPPQYAPNVMATDGTAYTSEALGQEALITKLAAGGRLALDSLSKLTGQLRETACDFLAPTGCATTVQGLVLAGVSSVVDRRSAGGVPRDSRPSMDRFRLMQVETSGGGDDGSDQQAEIDGEVQQTQVDQEVQATLDNTDIGRRKA